MSKKLKFNPHKLALLFNACSTMSTSALYRKAVAEKSFSGSSGTFRALRKRHDAGQAADTESATPVLGPRQAIPGSRERLDWLIEHVFDGKPNRLRKAAERLSRPIGGGTLVKSNRADVTMKTLKNVAEVAAIYGINKDWVLTGKGKPKDVFSQPIGGEKNGVLVNSKIIDLPATLQEVYRKILYKVNEADRHNALALYDIGLLVADVMANKSAYGVGAVEALAATLDHGLTATTLRTYARVATAFSRSELCGFLEQQMPNGRKLSFSHLIAISSLTDSVMRVRLCTNAISNGWTFVTTQKYVRLAMGRDAGLNGGSEEGSSFAAKLRAVKALLQLFDNDQAAAVAAIRLVADQEDDVAE